MSDTKHAPEMHEDANAVFECLKYHASAGGEYEYRGTLAIEAFTRMCNELAALRAAAEKARNRWIGYETALEEILKLEKSLGTAFSWVDLRSFKDATRKIALAALEEVLK